MSLGTWFRNLISPKPEHVEVALGRNDLCRCGSGKKYKKCHLKSDQINRVESSYSSQMTARQRMAEGVMPGTTKPRRLERPAEPAAKR